MLPYEEFSYVYKIITDNVNMSHDEIINILGKTYYKIYQPEIDFMIDKIKSKTNIDYTSLKGMKKLSMF